MTETFGTPTPAFRSVSDHINSTDSNFFVIAAEMKPWWELRGRLALAPFTLYSDSQYCPPPHLLVRFLLPTLFVYFFHVLSWLY